MDKKITRTLCKLVSVMPAELRDGWRFHVYNVGGAGSRPYYGIISENNILPGINIELCQSSREPWWDKKRERMDERKLTNVLAAYIAFAQPATVLALIEENDRLRKELDARAEVDVLQGEADTDSPCRPGFRLVIKTHARMTVSEWFPLHLGQEVVETSQDNNGLTVITIDLGDTDELSEEQAQFMLNERRFITDYKVVAAGSDDDPETLAAWARRTFAISKNVTIFA